MTLPGSTEGRTAMGYRQRERKRKQKTAQQRDQRTSRRSGSSGAKWWLTIVGTTTCCARCGAVLRAGREMVYRHRPREALCVACAERDAQVRRAYRPSLRWERQKGGGGIRGRLNRERVVSDRSGGAGQRPPGAPR